MTKHRRPLLAIGVVVVGGCGVGHRASTPAASARLGRPLATAPLTASGTRPRRVIAHAPTRAPTERIHLPATPQRTSTAGGVRATAGRFARAYLAYQIGHNGLDVRHAIRATCTPSLARQLLTQPASVAPVQRSNPAFAPATLARVSYGGRAWFGAGGPLQIALASYRTETQPPTRGTLLIELVRLGGRSLVAGVRPR